VRNALPFLAIAIASSVSAQTTVTIDGQRYTCQEVADGVNCRSRRTGEVIRSNRPRLSDAVGELADKLRTARTRPPASSSPQSADIQSLIDAGISPDLARKIAATFQQSISAVPEATAVGGNPADVADIQQPLWERFDLKRWVVLYEEENLLISFDTRTVDHHEGRHYLAWIRYDYAESRDLGAKKYDNTVGRFEIACGQPIRYRTFDFVFYRGKDLVRSEKAEPPTPWQNLVPDSVGEDAYTALCSILSPEKKAPKSNPH
jgi:hypothetical protein